MNTFGATVLLILNAGASALQVYLIKHYPVMQAHTIKGLLLTCLVALLPTLVLAVYTLIFAREQVYSRWKSSFRKQS